MVLGWSGREILSTWALVLRDRGGRGRDPPDDEDALLPAPLPPGALCSAAATDAAEEKPSSIFPSAVLRLGLGLLVIID
jgi:hypothetical protein